MSQRIAGAKQNNMEKLRKVEYYVSDDYNPDAGFMDGGDEKNKTAIGLFHRYADSYRIYKNAYHPFTKAIIEIEATGEIKHIDTKRLKRFIND